LNGFQLGRSLTKQRARSLSQATELVVMMHHGFAVGRELDVAFDREIA